MFNKQKRLAKANEKAQKGKTTQGSKDIDAYLDEMNYAMKGDNVPRSYVVAREPITLLDANEILEHAAIQSKQHVLMLGLDVAFASPPENSPLADVPLQQLMMAFIQQIDGGKYLSDEYTFVQYYHPAEGNPPRSNANKEYYVLAPIRKK
jgi:hypothetical protein